MLRFGAEKQKEDEKNSLKQGHDLYEFFEGGLSKGGLPRIRIRGRSGGPRGGGGGGEQ